MEERNLHCTAMMENDWDKYIIPDLDLIAALYINI